MDGPVLTPVEQHHEKDPNDIQCEQCEDPSAVLEFCSNCQVFYCDNCKMDHLKIKQFKTHHFRTVEEGISHLATDFLLICTLCKVHKVSSICFDCNDLGCAECLLYHHHGHHNVCIEKIAPDWRQTLKNQIAQITVRKEEVSRDVQEKARQWTIFKEKLKQDEERCYPHFVKLFLQRRKSPLFKDDEELKAILQQDQAALIQEIENYADSKSKEYGIFQADMQALYEGLIAVEEHYQRLTSNVNLVHQFDDLMERCETLMNWKPSDILLELEYFDGRFKSFEHYTRWHVEHPQPYNLKVKRQSPDQTAALPAEWPFRNDSKVLERLFQSVEVGNAEWVGYLLITHQNVEINQKDQKGQTLLHHACKRQSDSILNILRFHPDIDMNILDSSGRTPFIHSCMQNAVDCARCLLSDPRVQINLGHIDNTPPMRWVAMQKEEILQWAITSKRPLDFGASTTGVTLVDEFLINPEQTRNTVLTTLNTAGCYVNASPKLTRERYVEFLKNRQKSSFTFPGSETSQQTKFWNAATLGDLKTIETLIKKKRIDINWGDPFGRTALFQACSHGRLEVVKYLIQRPDIDINRSTILGVTPLDIAIREKQIEIAEMLLQVDAVRPNIQRNNGLTPLHAACEIGNRAIVSTLLKRGASILTNSEDTGATPFLLACFHGHSVVVKTLLDYLDYYKNKNLVDIINKPDWNQCTPLWFAAYYGHLDIASMLLNQSNVKLNTEMESSGNSFWSNMSAVEIGKYRLRNGKFDKDEKGKIARKNCKLIVEAIEQYEEKWGA